jgi:hypothetical protein
MKNDKFDTFASIMSAVVLILGALAACLAVFAASSASDADSDGTAAAINLQETTISSNITAYEHFQAYVIYRRNDALVNLLWEASDTADSENAQVIERKIREIGGLSGELRHNFFPPGYILNERDVVAESYNVHREIAEARAEAARTKDLDSQVHFQRADMLRLRSLLLTADLIVFAIAFWFFTVAQALENKIKYLFAIGGVLMAFSGLVLILGAEVLL